MILETNKEITKIINERKRVMQSVAMRSSNSEV